MGCFIIPLTQAIVTTAVRKHLDRKDRKSILAKELPTLEKMLWGASTVLVVDHIANGELSLTAFPTIETLTAELLSVGVPMSLAVTAIWLGICIFKASAARRRTEA